MRIHKSLVLSRESFVHALLMQTPDLNFQAVNDTLALEENKHLWGGKGENGEPKPLMMAFKRVEEIREAAKVANEHVKNGLPVPPIPVSTLIKAKKAKSEMVTDNVNHDDTVVVMVDNVNGEDVVTPVVANDNPSEVIDSAAAAV